MTTKDIEFKIGPGLEALVHRFSNGYRVEWSRDVRGSVGCREQGALPSGAWQKLQFQEARGRKEMLDDRQITHRICGRLKHLLYDFLGVSLS